jgi:hypothetical protein
MPTNHASTPAGGPRTSAGKAKSCRNALRHGIFSSELTRSAAERAEIDALRNLLRTDREPEGALGELQLDLFVADAWVLKMAYRAVEKHLNSVLQESEPATDTSAESAAEFAQKSAPSLRNQMALLDELERQADSLRMSPDLQQAVTQAFGSDFWNTINHFDGKERIAKMFAEMLRESHKNYGVDLPPELSNLPDGEEEVPIDIDTQRQLVRKLIDLKRRHLLELDRVGQKAAALQIDQTHRCELAIRYLTYAQRAFYRTKSEYEAHSRPIAK